MISCISLDRTLFFLAKMKCMDSLLSPALSLPLKHMLAIDHCKQKKQTYIIKAFLPMRNCFPTSVVGQFELGGLLFVRPTG